MAMLEEIERHELAEQEAEDLEKQKIEDMGKSKSKGGKNKSKGGKNKSKSSKKKRKVKPVESEGDGKKKSKVTKHISTKSDTSTSDDDDDTDPAAKTNKIDDIIANASTLDKTVPLTSRDKTWIIVMTNGGVKSGNITKMGTALGLVGVTKEHTTGLTEVKKFTGHKLGQSYHMTKSLLTEALGITVKKLNEMAAGDWKDPKLKTKVSKILSGSKTLNTGKYLYDLEDIK